MKAHKTSLEIGEVTEPRFVQIGGDFSQAVTVIVLLKVAAWEPDAGSSLSWFLADTVDDESWSFVEDTDGEYGGRIGKIDPFSDRTFQTRRFVVPIAPKLAISVRPRFDKELNETDIFRFSGVRATVFWRSPESPDSAS